MALSEVITVATPELLLESVPETIPQVIDLLFPASVFGLHPSKLHPEDHHGPGKSPAQRSSPANPSTKPGCNLWQEGTLFSQIFLETQGNRLRSVKPLLKITPGLIRNLFFHVRLPLSFRIVFL